MTGSEPPAPFRSATRTLVWTSGSTGELHIPAQVLTAKEADAMACSLIEHARYAREREPAIAHGTDRILGPICGRLFDRKPSDTSAKVCQRPKGHPGACASEERTAPKTAPPTTSPGRTRR